MGLPTSLIRFVCRLSLYESTHFTMLSAYAVSRGRPEPRSATLLRHPIGNNALLEVQECLPAMHRLRLPASS